MAENTITTAQQEQANSLKRKFQKLKSKFFELFFVSSPSRSTSDRSVVSSAYNSNSNIEKSNSTTTLNNSMLISNCYYGYKSSLIESSLDDNHNNAAKKISKNATTLSSTSLNSPLTSQETNQNKLVSSISSASSSISSIVAHQDKQSANSTSEYFSRLGQTGYELYNHEFTDSINENNIINVINPFLNKKLTDLIQFNADLNKLVDCFDAYLNLIDDQDNFFNIDFMINYISYTILRNLSECEYIKKTLLKEANDANNNTTNLVKEIARQIYLESENEPCGLKGCKLNIYLETDAETCLLTQFRFDSTCSLTTFELNLTLKQYSGVDNNQSSSSLTNLTKRFLSTSSRGATSSPTKQKQNKKKTDNVILLDSVKFDLFKRKLY